MPGRRDATTEFDYIIAGADQRPVCPGLAPARATVFHDNASRFLTKGEQR